MAQQPSPESSSQVVAVIVTYHPDLARLSALLAAVRQQTMAAVVVDNGSAPERLDGIRQLLTDGQQLLPLGDNLGIATAQNRGLALAAGSGAGFVLLLDQDSVPAAGMVLGLLAHAERLLGAGEMVAAIGPRLLDARWDSEERLRPKGERTTDAALLRVDHIVASGALIPLSTVAAIGGMNEELFIDYVDIEWCLRAQREGYGSFIATDVTMDHQLGVPMQVLGRTMSTHSPMRHYYLVRNTIWLVRRHWLPRRWLLKHVPKIVLHLLINAVLAKPAREQRRMMWRGLRDGLAGRMGRGHDRGR